MAIHDSLIGMTRNYITPDFVKRASEVTGETPEKTQSGLVSAVPTMLMGLINRGSTHEGAGELINTVRDGHYDEGVPQDYMDHLRNGKGTDIVGKLFGAQSAFISEQVGASSGMRPGSSLKLMAMIAPVVMGVLGSRVRQQGYDSSTLTRFLDEQRTSVEGILPHEIAKILAPGREARLHETRLRAGERPSVKQPRSSTIPAAILVVLAIGGFFFVKNAIKPIGPQEPPVLNSKAGHLPQPLTMFLDTGHGEPKQIHLNDPSDQRTVKHIAASLKSHPTDKIRVAGEGATSFKGALVAQGIDPNRITVMS